MDVGIASGEREPASAIMITRRHVDVVSGSGRIRRLVAVAGGGKGAIIDAIEMFIDKDEGLGGQYDVGQFIVEAPLGTQPGTCAEDLPHRVAADARTPKSID